MFATHPDDTIQNISDLFHLFERRWTLSEPALFRGESSRFEHNLCPSAFRQGMPANEFQTYEIAFNKYMASDERDYMFDRLFPSVNAHSLASIALLQHYGTPTRFLDVSFNPLVALYFATASNTNQDGYIFACFGNYIDITNTTNETSLGQIVESTNIGDYRPYPDTLLLYRPEWHNTRSAAQSGAFLFTKGVSQCLWPSPAFRIPADRKTEIQKQLRRFAITESHLFPFVNRSTAQ